MNFRKHDSPPPFFLLRSKISGMPTLVSPCVMARTYCRNSKSLGVAVLPVSGVLLFLGVHESIVRTNTPLAAAAVAQKMPIAWGGGKGAKHGATSRKNCRCRTRFRALDVAKRDWWTLPKGSSEMNTEAAGTCQYKNTCGRKLFLAVRFSRDKP